MLSLLQQSSFFLLIHFILTFYDTLSDSKVCVTPGGRLP